MLSLKERSKLANVFFVYLFEERKTKKIICVGMTKYVGRRMREHKTDMLRKNNNLYVYMRDNDLELFKNVDVKLVDFCKTREEAAQKESELIKKYHDTVKNLVTLDTRKYSTDPRYLKVKCLTTGELFYAVAPVIKKFNVSRYKLFKAIKNKQAINGFMFDFV